MQCNAMQKVHKCYSLVHGVRSFVQSNAMLHKICYLFTEHGKELDLVCNAMQKVHGYVTIQCTTLDRLCNAMQQHCNLSL